MAVRTSRISSPAVRRPRGPPNTSRHNGGPVSSMSTTLHETLTWWRRAMPGMRVTLDAAMRARDVSKPRPAEEAAATVRAAPAQPQPGGPPQSTPQPGKATPSTPQPGKAAQGTPESHSGPSTPAERHRSGAGANAPGRSDATQPRSADAAAPARPAGDPARERPGHDVAQPARDAAQPARANSPRRRKRRRRTR